jgi:hypothetical protein
LISPLALPSISDIELVIGRLSDLMVFNLLAGGADVIHTLQYYSRGKEMERQRKGKKQEARARSD